MEAKIILALKPLPDLNFPDKKQVKMFIEVFQMNIENCGLEVKKDDTTFFFDHPNRMTVQFNLLGGSRINYVVRVVISKCSDKYFAQLHAFSYEKKNDEKKHFYLSDRIELTEFEEKFKSIIGNLI